MKVEDLRGTPMSVGNLEEIVDDSHAIVSSSAGSEYYVSVLSFVDKDALSPGTSVLLHHKVGPQREGGGDASMRGGGRCPHLIEFLLVALVEVQLMLLSFFLIGGHSQLFLSLLVLSFPPFFPSSFSSSCAL